MSFLKTALPAVAVAGGLTAGVLGLGAPASAQPPPPPPPAPPALAAESPQAAPRPAPPPGEPVPPWAPPKPAEFWIGEPVVWISGWGGRWGVWKNGQFITLSSNVVTGGG
ncbi:hypothetical protein [Mycolicibacterium celeriflavum]|uniref:Uncharacterized protein n=1 Tax=Mycolicibacterium celeriflavum TaxID=1249101 RepID=A0A1X0BUG0_MYCCF|nr:hypothetical protein [Mycolicibacterium celeriflavum]MCV7240919.1 hypothetical protein [Mycolicibacterium celeriflavum]ORA47567.1 hypothetical protein BST21_12760 [Mycolicibacterium celeriflavum]BBY42374.1 hypothetical protein MCEL_06690 [Mycolicibacterium celeriflavum]